MPTVPFDDTDAFAIYEAAFSDDAFENLPNLLARAGAARSGMVNWAHRDGALEVMGFTHFTRELIERFTEYLPIDPWTVAGKLRPNSLLRLDRHVSDRDFESSLVYNELIRAFGDDTFRCMGGVFSSPWGTGILSVHRGKSEKPFDADEEARLRRFLPHFRKVLFIRGELAAARREVELARIAPDRLAVCTLTVAQNHRVLSLNAAAQEVLQRADGLVSVGGILTGAHAQASDCIAKAIAKAAATPPASSSFSITRGFELPPYLVTACPASQAGNFVVILIFRDPDISDATIIGRLRSWFGLSAAEACIAIGIAEGHAVNDLAAVRSVSLNTLRTQIKAISARMGVRRQSEIAAIVCSIPPIREF